MSKDLVKKAVYLAKKLHKGQFRKSGEPYFEHPLSVMKILKKYDFPDEVLAAAILHDICEDTNTTNLHIREEFGDRVGFIVNALTKNHKPRNNKELKKKFEEQKVSGKYGSLQEFIDYRFLMYVNRFYVGIIAEPWIMFIKMADQIHNVSTMGCFTREKRQRKVSELKEYFIPVYKKAEELVTPMYIKKYEGLMKDLFKEIEKIKKSL